MALETPVPPPRGTTLADRTYRQTSAVGIGTAVVWTVVWAALGMQTLVWLGVLGLAGMVAARALRFRLGYPATTRISVLACLVIVVGAIVETGGMEGPFGIMMIILPLGPALALGTAEALRWGGVVLCLGGGLWAWAALVAPFADRMPEAHHASIVGLAQFTVLAATLLCLFSYGRMHEVSRDRLRRNRARLEEAHRELQLSQQKLLVSEKMAALGRLTAGMAHEINSSLAGAINSLELAGADADSLHDTLERRGPAPEDASELLGELRESVGLASTALAKIAAFVRRMRGQTAVGREEIIGCFSPAEEAATVLRLLQVSLMEKRITLEAELARDRALRGDPARFGQIVQNLVANAADAYDGRPGVVAVRIHPAPGAVVVEVEDRGSGIPEEIRAHIFDHFFTTKPTGEGTGLGLAMVHDLATRYFGGTIEFETEVGRGTRFVVRLPSAEDAG